ncbi:hypothetical protein Javan220_0021 [Streptococcus phage Javan220]|nr:hypothetical protein Javan220_0021 [Streptococcus phage Javan220]SFR59658.1 Protein of unknown function [Streptococcus equinus]
MNKQEVMKEINNLPKYYANGACVEFEKVSELINQLDEPEKPEVPQFVADWYEEDKRDFENLIYALCVKFYTDDLPKNLHDWFVDTENEPIQTLVKMHQFGYEVEKVKLYTARLKLLTSKKYSFISKDKVEDKLIISGPDDVNGLYQVRFTQAELEGLGVWDNPAFEVDEVKE